LLEQPAVATEGIEALRAEYCRIGISVGAFVRINPSDFEAFSREKTFCVGDQLGQSLEWGGMLDNQRFHLEAPILEH
jgi:hypothetical protein